MQMLSLIHIFGLLRPGGQHFKHINIGLAFGLVQLQTDFAVNLSDGKAPNVLQGKEGVHEANIAVYVRDGQGIGGDFKEARQRPGQVGLGGTAPGFIPVSYTHLDVYKRQDSCKLDCTSHLHLLCRTQK